MSKFISALREIFAPKIKPSLTKGWKIVLKHSTTPGLVPTLEQLWYDKAVAINYADDIVYRNEKGVIVKYVRVKEEVCSSNG